MKEVTQEVYLKWYEDAFGESEDKLAALYIQQKVRGFYIYNGQEAVLCVARNGLDKDRMITAYRNHVQPIGMGVDPKRVMAELLGKVTGLLKEWVVPCIFSPTFYGGHGIVGGQIL
jgi:pyruvate dehydrogenase E1 component alpha subunit